MPVYFAAIPIHLTNNACAAIGRIARYVYEGDEPELMEALTAYELEFGNASSLLASFLSSCTGSWYEHTFHTWVALRGGAISPLVFGQSEEGFWPEFPEEWVVGEYDYESDDDDGEPILMT